MSVVDDFLRQPRFCPGDPVEKSPREWLIEFWNYLDDQGYLADRNLAPGRPTRLQKLLSAGEGALAALACPTLAYELGRDPQIRTAYTALVEALSHYEGRPHAAPQKPPAKTDRGEAG